MIKSSARYQALLSLSCLQAGVIGAGSLVADSAQKPERTRST